MPYNSFELWKNRAVLR